MKRNTQLRNPVILAAKNRPCADCYGWFEPCQMDFDHIEGAKRFNISTGKNRGLLSLLLEMDKCEVVCANCHRLRTFKRMQQQGL